MRTRRKMVSWIGDINMGNPRKNFQRSIREHNQGPDCGLEVTYHSCFFNFGGMFDSTAGTGNVQDRPGTSCPTRMRRSHHASQLPLKDSETALKKLPLSKDGIILAPVWIIVKTVDQKPANILNFMSL